MISKNQLYQIQQTIDQLFATMSNSNISQQQVYTATSKLLLNVNEIANQYNMNLNLIYGSYSNFHNIITGVDSIEGLYTALKTIHENLYDLLSKTLLPSNNDYIKNAVVYIFHNFEKDLSLSKVAEEIAVNPSYLSTLFKKEFNMGFSHYLINFRIEKACQLIKLKNNSLKEISFMSGFKDYDYFLKVFKKNNWQNTN